MPKSETYQKGAAIRRDDQIMPGQRGGSEVAVGEKKHVQKNPSVLRGAPGSLHPSAGMIRIRFVRVERLLLSARFSGLPVQIGHQYIRGRLDRQCAVIFPWQSSLCVYNPRMPSGSHPCPYKFPPVRSSFL